MAPLRAAVLAHSATPDQVIATINGVVTGIIDSLRLPLGADLATAGGRQVLALDTLLRLNEGINLGGVLLTYAVASRSPVALVQLSASYQITSNLSATFTTYAGAAQAALFNQVLLSMTTRVGGDFISILQSNSGAALGRISVRQAFDTTQAGTTIGRFVEEKIATDITRQVNARQRGQTQIAYAAGGLALLLVLLMALLSAAVARAVARPLTRLTRSAERVARVAEEELVRVADDEAESVRPVRLDAVDTGGRDEIGDLARAFERVQTTAAGLVERQAVSRRNVAQMFGHVGRRTQNLVGRQLALIDRLERAETDPSRLSDLYRLDHVSNRLRRNAGSLVVLSGGTGGDDHLAPMPLGDVVRLALGEIEDYTRVVVDVSAHLVVVPAVVGDLVLVAAELMENATAFSPPHTSVSVFATATHEGVRLSIVDHGIGLPAERLAEENARLTRRERLDLAPTEVLGLFVVGRLARRHGLAVVLTHTPGGGITAEVDLPDRLLAGPPTAPVLILAGTPAPAGPSGVVASTRAVGRVSASRSVFNITTLQRSLEAGPSWNAFATPTPTPPPVPSAFAPTPPTGMPVVAPLPRRPTGGTPPSPPPVGISLGTPLPVRPVNGQPPVNGAPVVPVDMPTAGMPPPGMPGGPPLEPEPPAPLPPRRVPGATLAAHLPSVPPSRPAEPASADPEEVRAAVEQFEFGIARALREVDPDRRD
jgi:signal transduction histidine kinase